MKIYIDGDFKCHVKNTGGLTEVENSFFDGKCRTFIEGYRLKPDGETWISENGTPISGGEMITPWKPYDELDAAQREYERELAEAARILLGEVSV